MLVMALAATGGVQAAPKDKAKETAQHAKVVKYWTPKRMANAVPRDFAKKNGKFVPAARGGNPGKPPKDPGDGGDGGDGGDALAVTGADWTGGGSDGGAVQQATGKVFFTMGGRDYTCSGAVVNDATEVESLVLSAGHCIYDESNDEFATNWMFIPNYEDSTFKGCDHDELGCHSAHGGDLYVHPQYASASSFNSQAVRHDWGFARVSDPGETDLDELVPAFGIEFSDLPEHRYSFGYPADRPYDGQRLIYCAGNVISDPGMDGDTWGMRCDMTPGSSGGPWMKEFSGSSGTLNSVNSYGYRGGQLKDYMFGPKFGSKTEAVYDAATGNGGNAESN